MATGTGKTYTAFQIVYRLLKSGFKKKVLYLADRNILVDQSIQQDFSPLEKVIHKINFAKDDPVTITSHEVYFSLYQQLAGNEENEDEESGEETVARFAKLFNKDFFDLIIVDECHRGSAKKDSNWRKILDYFSSATQIGMTATPKETKYISNIDYFGEPVYTYSLREGIEDGFLAPFKVINITTDISDGWRPYKGQLDKFGNVIEDRIYTNSDFDYNIILEDRTYEVAKEITEYLKSTDRMQKTIVFCATEDHAERMRIALNNLNADMVKENPDYVVRITGSDTYGKSKLDYFISVSAPYPVIATTSKLLSTGADCKMTKLIVLDEMINSMTEFKQIIGRGTRLREKEGKNHFVVMDFRNVTRLFSDPDWDGPIEIVEGFDPNHKPTPKPDTPGNGGDPVSPPPTVDKYVVDENGCDVHIIGKRVEVYDTQLLSEFNLHTVVRMPGSVFAPYTSITTNILFFDRTKPTEETWFYRLDMPEGYKHFSKTKPMKLEHFEPVIEWWNNRQEISIDGFDKAKKYTAYKTENGDIELRDSNGLVITNYNLDLCGYPHIEEEILDPMDLIQRYQEERASLNAEIDRVLADITAILGGGQK